MLGGSIRTSFALRADTVAKLDHLAKQWKINRSEALRRIIDQADEEASRQLEALEALRMLPESSRRAWAEYGQVLKSLREADDEHRGF